MVATSGQTARMTPSPPTVMKADLTESSDAGIFHKDSNKLSLFRCSPWNKTIFLTYKIYQEVITEKVPEIHGIHVGLVTQQVLNPGLQSGARKGLWRPPLAQPGFEWEGVWWGQG